MVSTSQKISFVRQIPPTPDLQFLGKRKKQSERKTFYYMGSFNPIHNGHLLLAKTLRQQGFNVVFVPVFSAPHKNPREMASFEDRFEMTKAAIQGEKGFSVSDVERHLPPPSFTIQTLRKLVLNFDHRRARIPFPIGVDALLQLPTWREAATLITKLIFYVAPRNGEKVPEFLMVDGKRYKLKTKLIKMDECPVSSTMIREKSRKGESIRGLVPNATAEILEKKKIYS